MCNKMFEYKDVYSTEQKDLIKAEFSRLKDTYYLDHTGATLYSETQIKNIHEDLLSNVYGNPHSFNLTSKYTEDVIDQMRSKIAGHFNTNLDEYSVIFVSGATGALKLVGESFDYSNDGIFMYLEDNHTSVLGMREFTKNKILSQDDAFEIFNNKNANMNDEHLGHSLFVYPAQSNFSGTKYPLEWIEKVQNGVLNNISGQQPTKWFCMLDTASYVSCNKLDLNIFKPDFLCLSFYKIFGYPTGLGALLVKNSSAHVLKKKYFGGGTVQIALNTEHVSRPVLNERFEDGTIPFLTIISLRHGFEILERLSLNMDLISEHTFLLAKYVHHNLLSMHHHNGNPVAILYHDTNFEDCEYQGGIVNFNLLRANGKYIGYSEVLHISNLYKINLRTGCFCNPGACRKHLKLSQEDVKQQFNAGHVCGDQNDLIDGKPTGSVRISFGYMSTKEEADKFLQMIGECFLTKPIIKKIPHLWNKFEAKYHNNFCIKKTSKQIIKNNSRIDETIHRIENHLIITNGINDIPDKDKEKSSAALKYIFVYPVKSCGAYSVKGSWEIQDTGLIYDREWMIVNSSGVCLTQKHDPNLCLIKPNINLKDKILELNYPDKKTAYVTLSTNECVDNSDASLCQSKVCGDRVNCVDCGDEIANWLCDALQRSDLRLFRQNSNHIRTNRKGEKSQLTLVNQAHYLLINIASIKYLATAIPNHNSTSDEYLYNLIARFRANLVVDYSTAFEEMSCNKIKIGNHIFKCTSPCTRCQMICIDQLTAEKTVEPLRTLSVLTESKIRFGIYLLHESSCTNQIQIRKDEIVLFLD